MLWSLGFVVLLIDILHRLNLEGFDLADKRPPNATDIHHVLIASNTTHEEHHIHPIHPAALKAIGYHDHAPIHSLKWLDNLDIARVLAPNAPEQDRIGPVDPMLKEKNIHALMMGNDDDQPSPPSSPAQAPPKPKPLASPPPKIVPLTTTEEPTSPNPFALPPEDPDSANPEGDDPEKNLHFKTKTNLVSEHERKTKIDKRLAN